MPPYAQKAEQPHHIDGDADGRDGEVACETWKRAFPPDRHGPQPRYALELDDRSFEARQPTVVVIEPRRFIRECIVRTLAMTSAFRLVSGFASSAEWVQEENFVPKVDIVLVAARESRRGDTGLTGIEHVAPSIPIIILGDSEDGEAVVEALDQGARGYIPTSTPLDVAVEAIQLVRVGGVYGPVRSLMAAPCDPAGAGRQPGGHMFTTRQLAVISCLRKGKSNKVIAYELGMQEGTVKVHLRNIMRKLKATNRTQVVSLTGKLFDEDGYAYGRPSTRTGVP